MQVSVKIIQSTEIPLFNASYIEQQRPLEWLSGIHAAPLSVAEFMWSNTGDPGIDPASDDFLDQ